jgi:hypothetical protein
VKTNTPKKSGLARKTQSLLTTTKKFSQGGLGRFSLKAQVFLVAWMLVASIVAACLLWIHHKSWIVAMFASLASFIWHARITIAELFLELWVFILREFGRKE